MASLDLLNTRKILAKGQIVRNGTDGPVAIRIRNKANKAVTSVTVITGTNIILIDSDGTTTSTFATDTTIAAVAGRINASSNWEAKILDALSSDASVSRLVDGAIAVGTDMNGNLIYDVKYDTSTALEIGCCLSPFRDFDNPKGHRVNLKNVKYGVNMGTAAVNSAQLYLRVNGVETLILGELSVDTTETTVLDFTGGPYAFQTTTDAELFYRVKDAATLADATSNYVRLIGEIE